MLTPREFIDSIVLRDLDLLAVKAPERVLQAFAGLEAEADARAQGAFEVFAQSPGEGDPGDHYEDARDEGIS